MVNSDRWDVLNEKDRLSRAHGIERALSIASNSAAALRAIGAIGLVVEGDEVARIQLHDAAKALEDVHRRALDAAGAWAQVERDAAEMVPPSRARRRR